MITVLDLTRLLREDSAVEPAEALKALGVEDQTVIEFVSAYVMANVLPVITRAPSPDEAFELVIQYMLATSGRMLALGISAGRQFPAPGHG